MKSRFALLSFLLVAASGAGAAGVAEPLERYMDFDCGSGAYALRLPATLPQVMKLGAVLRTVDGQTEDWSDRSTTTYREVTFKGMTLGFWTFSDNPKKYMLSYAEIQGKQWQHLAPFHVGQPAAAARRALGRLADGDTELAYRYGDLSGVSFKTRRGRVAKVTYDCYTG